MEPTEKKIGELVETTAQAVAPISEKALSWLSAGSTYSQAGYILLSISLAWGITWIIHTVYSEIADPKKSITPFSRPWFLKRSGRLICPFLTILFLNLMEPIAYKHLDNQAVIHAAQRVAYVWMLWVILKAYITNSIVRTVGVWLLVPASLLQMFGLFDDAVKYLESYGFKLGDVEITAYTFLKAIFFICIIFWIGKIIRNTAERYIRDKQSLTRTTQELLIKVFDILLYSILFLITLNLVGIDLTALAVFSGALGVGLGFGLQKIASNFISGIILLTEKSVNINNLVEMNDGVHGYVRKLGARASIVETFCGKEVMVPNEDFITSRVANLTHSNPKGRISIPIGVSYDSDLHKVRDLILAAVNSYDPAIKEEEDYQPGCYLREYGDSSVNFLLTFWIDDVTQGRWCAQSDVMFKIWDSFKEHNIEIPFPQRDLNIRTTQEQIFPAPVQQTA
ncbi:mechanosensitive ion channel family protein [Terasakiella pusilla]|uniref:mechanosensitive ion channel family protein n=1 Tax=Terasakiella pusilla TaxID=64973 RepID=UPI00068B32BC|nr:mechanosensitive ion channel domain-containing protein [Terasakiella pusilla]